MVSSGTRYLSLFLPHLALETGPRKAPDLDKPRAAFAKAKGAHRLVAVDGAARRLGLSPGLSLADARAIAPDLDTVEHDPAVYDARLAAVADWCRRFTPLAALDPPDGTMLDITGVTHLFGGEAALAREIEQKLARQGITGLCAIASSPEAAWALARFDTTRIAAQEDKRLLRLISHLPVAALRLDAETVAALGRAGLKQIGDIHMRPRAPIAARFGPKVFATLDAMLGLSRSAISPRFEAPAYMIERRFAEGVGTREQIELTIGALAQELCLMLERHGEGARRLCATLFRVDGVVRHIHAGTSRPTRDPKALARLFRETLEAAGKTRDEDPLDIGYGFDLIRLAATEVELLDPTQAVLAQRRATSPSQNDFDFSDGERAEYLADLVDRLGARLGTRRVLRLIEQDTHLPEHAALAVPAAELRTRALPKASFESAASETPDRPIRLFERPEPVEAIASVPDGPPLRFRWRRLTHEVAAIEGPERIAPEWWRQEASALTRDYFRVEDVQGHRFWLFREGLYGSETPRPRWYVHGLFA
jgi:protein ImuB